MNLAKLTYSCGAFALTLGLSFFGCSGKHFVAGLEQTRAEKLEASAASWCQTACKKIGACPCQCNGDFCDCQSDSTECVSGCEKGVRQFTGGSDFCASIGERLKNCIDTASCGGFDACSPTDDEESTCKAEVEGDSDQPPQGIPTTGPNGGLVVCTAGDGGGSGPTTDGVVTCQEDRAQCSDGHTYNWMCVIGPTSRDCSCLMDGLQTRNFDPGPSCPTQAAVNLGCGFNLQEI